MLLGFMSSTQCVEVYQYSQVHFYIYTKKRGKGGVSVSSLKRSRRKYKNIKAFISNFQPTKNHHHQLVMASIMEKPPLSSSHLQRDEHDLISLKDWSLKPNKIISRENTKSRRFSASNIRALTEETRSFRSYNAPITSTASSPGYILRDAEIDPSSYSFTTALRSLQVKSGYNWEYLSSPDGFALHSKWNEAERYICNPLSGEVPIECLSAKTLSGRCINRIPISTSTTTTTTLKSRITVSGPLIYSSSPHHVHSKPTLTQPEDTFIKSPIQVEKVGMKKDLIMMHSSSTRDVGTQSTPPYISSSSPSPTSTPSIKERSLVRALRGDDESPRSGSKSKILEKEEVEGKEKRENEEATKKEEDKKKDRQMWKWIKPFGRGGGGCCCCCCLLPWMTSSTLRVRKRQQRGKHTSQVNFESSLE